MSAAAHKLVQLTGKQRQHFGWMDAPHLKRVIAALDNAEKGSARFVGGCVRDSLLAVEPKDFDIATTLKPDTVIAALKAAGLRAAPTGIDHGTITAIVDHQGVEVTTLRSDVSTDGRRATVAFTRDWAVDASRRDFRLNAIYLTLGGLLFDPVGGMEDVKERRVRFIGDPDERIREDFLRILRFFRFSARFSEAFDAAGLAACAKLKDGVAQLSAERIGAEFMAILSLQRASFALSAMRDAGILREIWPEDADIAAVNRLKAVEPAASAPLVLAVLYGAKGGGVGERLRLSNAEKAIRSKALAGAEQIFPEMEEQKTRELIYRLGKDVFSDAIAAACAVREIGDDEYQRLKSIADHWTPPALTISGKDILDAGIAQGPAVAKILKAVETQWVAEHFPDAVRLRAILKEQLARHNSGSGNDPAPS